MVTEELETLIGGDLGTVMDALAALTSKRGLDATAHELIRAGQTLTGAQGGQVALRTGAGQAFEIRASAGLGQDEDLHGADLVSGGPSRAALHSPNEPFVTESGWGRSMYVALAGAEGPVALAAFHGLPEAAAHDGGLALMRSFARLAGGIVASALALDDAIELATTDALTGLANRRSLDDRVRLEMSRARGFAKSFSLLTIDIDHFKQVNDRYGHAAGDAVLRQLAGVLFSELREVDLAARMGGDELAAVLPLCNRHVARGVAERALRSIEVTIFELPNGKEIQLTASVGIATFPGLAFDIESLFERSDRALYAAKRAGRNRQCSYAEVLAGELSDDPGRLPVLLTESMANLLPILAALDLGAPSLEAHSIGVATAAAGLARELGLSEEDTLAIERAGLLHDLGMACLPHTFFDGDRPRDRHSWEQYAQHPAKGAELLAAIPDLGPLLPAIRHHHERYDGRGYPEGLRGTAIPLFARILAVADHHATLNAPSAFGRHDPSRAIRTIIDRQGSYFDPEVVRAFIRWIDGPTDEPQSRGSEWLQHILEPDPRGRLPSSKPPRRSGARTES